jgi:hypothetical protein
LSKESFGIELFSGGSGLARENDLSWLDATSLSDMSSDGKTVVFEEGGDTASGSGFDLYLRRTDGTPPVKLGYGTNGVLSPDKQWVLAVSGTPDALILLPSGVGEPRTIDSHGIRSYLAPGWFADGKRIVFAGNEGNGWHMYTQEISGGKPTVVTPVIDRPGTYENRLLSPDGRYIWARDLQQKAWLYPVDGGGPTPLATLGPQDVWIGWRDDDSAYVASGTRFPVQIFRLDFATGKRTTVCTLMPADRSGVSALVSARMTPDGRTYAYAYSRVLSRLYLVAGLK